MPLSRISTVILTGLFCEYNTKRAHFIFAKASWINKGEETWSNSFRVCTEL